MRKAPYLIFLMLFFSMSLFGDGFNKYNEILVNSYQMGEGKYMFKYIEFPNPIDASGPNGMGFDSHGQLYITDTWKSRVVILNQSFKIDKIIDLPEFPVFGTSEQLMITADGIVGQKISKFFRKIDLQGKKIFELDLLMTRWNDRVEYGNFIIVGNNIFYYQKDGTPVLFYDLGPDSKQNLQNTLTSTNLKNLLASITTDTFTDKGVDALQSIHIEGTRIMKNNELLTRDFQTYIEYWKEENKYKRIPDYIKKLPADIDMFNINNTKTYLGDDKDKNTYWCIGQKHIFVFNKHGWLIDAFEFNRRVSQTIPALHPSGDIYLLDYDSKEARLYKIPRVW